MVIRFVGLFHGTAMVIRFVGLFHGTFVPQRVNLMVAQA